MRLPMRALLVFLSMLTLVSLAVLSQEKAAQPPSGSSSQTSVRKETREASRESAEEEKEENIELKQSPMVKKVGGWLGLGPKTAYWASLVLNFVLMLGLIYFFTRSKLPEAFRARTAAIQKGMEEARKASEEAQKRLSEIESRLAKLDSGISEMRAAAEAEIKKEEESLVATAEEDKKKIVEGAQQEIAAAARGAQRELKAFVAELAVSLASKNMQVDSQTDRELVRGFSQNLPAAETSAKDGK